MVQGTPQRRAAQLPADADRLSGVHDAAAIAAGQRFRRAAGSAAIRIAAAGAGKRRADRRAADRADDGRPTAADDGRGLGDGQLSAWGGSGGLTTVRSGGSLATVIWLSTAATPGSSDTSFSITSRWLSLGATPRKTTVSPTTSTSGAVMLRRVSRLLEATADRRGDDGRLHRRMIERHVEPHADRQHDVFFLRGGSPIAIAAAHRAIELLEELVRVAAELVEDRGHVALSRPTNALAALWCLRRTRFGRIPMPPRPEEPKPPMPLEAGRAHPAATETEPIPLPNAAAPRPPMLCRSRSPFRHRRIRCRNRSPVPCPCRRRRNPTDRRAAAEPLMPKPVRSSGQQRGAVRRA